jgi:cell division septation protein DedD
VATAAPGKPTENVAANTPPANGPWRVQLGAFAVRGNADRLWTRLSGRGELAGKAKVTVPAGAITKLQAGGYASRDSAEQACRSLKRSGQDCLVTQ